MQIPGRRLLFFVVVVLAICPTTVFADDVDSLLKRWSECAAELRAKGIHGTARLFAYDEAFQTETRGRVEFWISGPEEWRVDFAPAEIKGQQSGMRTPAGATYSLKPHRHERWSQSATEVTQAVVLHQGLPEVHRTDIRITAIAKSRPEWASPEADRNAPYFWKIANALSEIPYSISETLPGVIQLACRGLSSDTPDFQLQRREDWNVTLGKMHGERCRIHIVLQPRSEQFQRSFSTIEVLLNAADFTPFAVRMHDAAGTSNTVYVFEQVGGVAYDEDPFGSHAAEKWPPACERELDDRPPPPPFAIPL